MLNKIKTLKEIIEPIANKRGIPFEEYLEFISDKDRFELIFNQLEKKSKHKNLGSFAKIERYFWSVENFIKICENYFYLTPNNDMLNRFNDLTVNVINQLLCPLTPFRSNPEYQERLKAEGHHCRYQPKYIDSSIGYEFEEKDRISYLKVYGRIKELNMFHKSNVFEISNSVENELIEFARSIFGNRYDYDHKSSHIYGRIDSYIFDKIRTEYTDSSILSKWLPQKDFTKTGIFKNSDFSVSTNMSVEWAISENHTNSYCYPTAFHETYVSNKSIRNIKEFKERVFEYIEFLESKNELIEFAQSTF